MDKEKADRITSAIRNLQAQDRYDDGIPLIKVQTEDIHYGYGDTVKYVTEVYLYLDELSMETSKEVDNNPQRPPNVDKVIRYKLNSCQISIPFRLMDIAVREELTMEVSVVETEIGASFGTNKRAKITLKEPSVGNVDRSDVDKELYIPRREDTGET